VQKRYRSALARSHRSIRLRFDCETEKVGSSKSIWDLEFHIAIIQAFGFVDLDSKIGGSSRKLPNTTDSRARSDQCARRIGRPEERHRRVCVYSLAETERCAIVTRI
jgi:hypothetical protein